MLIQTLSLEMESLNFENSYRNVQCAHGTIDTVFTLYLGTVNKNGWNRFIGFRAVNSINKTTAATSMPDIPNWESMQCGILCALQRL